MRTFIPDPSWPAWELGHTRGRGITSCLFSPERQIRRAHGSSRGGLSATVKSPPDFPSDKPNKLNFFRLIDQLTSERCNAATWIFFHAAYLASGHRGAESNVKLQRDQELCWSPHASARALRWVPKPTCNYLWLEGAPHGQKRNISSG